MTTVRQSPKPSRYQGHMPAALKLVKAKQKPFLKVQQKRGGGRKK
jgi:hypothetical protein